ncbi:hypothetical protein [Mesomycoplasma molare]|uniref:Uncharacterized protein n=1 Tax=Mesomycoplasma molare TaxID=171288 RepID=A0ABY5TTR0_9BACT|nr:hypothetical protein [Mesomycoplasma molare]UWD33975.1 hypothetical protein NX772_02605 [Mesomycoplasma molare]
MIIGTSLLSISGLWQVATWNHDKWLPGIGENFNWFISWLILVSISGIIFISTIIYSLVKFIYSYKEFKDSKTIIKRNDENLKIIKNFYDNGIISKDIIDLFIKNILIIQKINTKNDK